MFRSPQGPALPAVLGLLAILLPMGTAPYLDRALSPLENEDFEKPLTSIVSGRPFKVGEKLEFSIQYGPIKAGTALMQINEIKDVVGYPCYRAISTAESNKFFSTFFKVRDRVESFLDVKDLYSRRFSKSISEGKYRLAYTVDFDHENFRAVYSDGSIFEIAPRTHDILSALYYMRTLDLKVGDTVIIENHTDKKNYPLEVKVYRKEEIETPAGKFNCLMLEPLLRGAGVFQQKGRLFVWVTDDERKVPVLMKSKIMIGSISAILQRMNPGEG